MKNITYFNAGAGAGKTYKLTSIIVEKFKNDADLTPDNIILTTFTKAAAAEFRQKTRVALLDAGLIKAVNGFEDAKIGTVHSIGLRYIEKYWYLLGRSSIFTEVDDNELKEQIAKTLSEVVTEEDAKIFHEYVHTAKLKKQNSTKFNEEFWINDVADLIDKCETFNITNLDKFRDDSLSKIEALVLNTDVNVENKDQILDKIKPVINSVFRIAEAWRSNYEKFKSKHNILSFNDMERLFLKLLDHEVVKQDIKESIKYVFVDEFQDSNPTQLKIFDKLSELVEHSYWVGDPKQAIYQFRGCDTQLVVAIMKQIKEEKNGCKFDNSLTYSWRSMPQIVKLTNNVFTKHFEGILSSEEIKLTAKRDEKELEGTRIYNWIIKPQKVEGSKSKGDNHDSLITATVLRIREILNHKDSEINKVVIKGTSETRPIKPFDIAILCNSNKDVNDFVKKLKKYQLPVNAMTEVDKINAECRLVLCLLNYMVDKSPKLLRAELRKLVKRTPLATLFQNQEGDEELFQKLDAIREETHKASVYTIVNRLITGLNLMEICGSWDHAFEREQVLRSIKLLAKEYDSKQDASIEGFIASFPDTITNSGNPEGITVSTMHRAKGLEWPVVILDSKEIENVNTTRHHFLSGIIVTRQSNPTKDNLYCDYMLRYTPKFISSSMTKISGFEKKLEKEFTESYLPMKQQEIVRQLYVAITRARDTLITISKLSKETIEKSIFQELGIAPPKPIKPDCYARIWGDNTDVCCQYITKEDKEESSTMEHTYTHFATSPSSEKRPLQKILPSQAPVIQGIKADVLYDSLRRITTKGHAEDSVLGTCLHNMFAVYNYPVSNCEQISPIFERIRANYDLEKELPNIGDVCTSIENLYKFLEENYGAGYAEKEFPFVMETEQQIVSGEIDLMWVTEQGVVIIDYKTYQGTGILDEKNEFFAGRYSGQLSLYKQAAEKNGLKVRDTLIYYAMQGKVIKLG